MAGTKSPRVKDDITKKRKRDTNDSDGKTKRHRQQQSLQNKVNGGGERNNQQLKHIESGAEATDTQPLTTFRPQEIIRQSDDGDAGWRVSKPMGGRILDIDPILTADEK